MNDSPCAPNALVESLVRQYQARLRGYLFSRTRDWAVTDDLAQDVFLTVLKQWESFDQNRSAWAWLIGIARNKLHEHLRASSRQKKVELVEEFLCSREDVWEESPSSGNDVYERQYAALKECLCGLPSHSRNLLDLAYDTGLNCQQIAERLSKPSGTIRSTLHRIRTALLACMRKYHDANPI